MYSQENYTPSAKLREVQARQERRGLLEEFCNQFIRYDLVHLSVVAHTLVGNLV
jgi:hypothetical protein